MELHHNKILFIYTVRHCDIYVHIYRFCGGDFMLYIFRFNCIWTKRLFLVLSFYFQMEIKFHKFDWDFHFSNNLCLESFNLRWNNIKRFNEIIEAKKKRFYFKIPILKCKINPKQRNCLILFFPFCKIDFDTITVRCQTWCWEVCIAILYRVSERSESGYLPWLVLCWLRKTYTKSRWDVIKNEHPVIVLLL